MKWKELLKEKAVLVADGAWGTELARLGLKAGEIPEIWNVEQAEKVGPAEKYDFHIEAPAELRQTLKDSAELAYHLGDIPKPNLVYLMNLFIGWGESILKRKWLDRMGYK